MALKTKAMRKMSADERNNALGEARKDLMHERGVAAMGGAPANPGKIRALRRQIARLLTIRTEASREGAKVPAKKTAKTRGSR